MIGIKIKARIYGFDIDDHVKNMARLNLLFEANNHFETLRDTLSKDIIIEENTTPLEVDIILANELYGYKKYYSRRLLQKNKRFKNKRH